jgi:hypothetical protein
VHQFLSLALIEKPWNLEHFGKLAYRFFVSAAARHDWHFPKLRVSNTDSIILLWSKLNYLPGHYVCFQTLSVLVALSWIHKSMNEIDVFVFHLMSLKGRLLQILFSIQFIVIKKETKKSHNLFAVYLVF